MARRWSVEEFWAQVMQDEYNSQYQSVIEEFVFSSERLGILVWNPRTTTAKLAGFTGIVAHDEFPCPIFTCWAMRQHGGNGVELLYPRMGGPFQSGHGNKTVEMKRRFQAIGLYGENKQRPNFEYGLFAEGNRVKEQLIVTIGQ